MYSSSTPYAVTSAREHRDGPQHRAVAAHFGQAREERIGGTCVRVRRRRGGSTNASATINAASHGATIDSASGSA